jgi:hypothetical protein
MKYNIQQETTVWDTTAPNHIYVFDGPLTGRTAKAVAYCAFGTEPVQRFSKPMVLDLKGRTFKKVD